MEVLESMTCADCGKSFVIMDKSTWCYKKRDRTSTHFNLYYCSWGCMLKAEKRKEKKDEDHS